MYSAKALFVPFVVLALMWGTLPAQDDAGTGNAAQDNPDSAVPAADDNDANRLREQTIYIPYTKLRTLFEKEGRGVFLPYEEFQTLWQAAREKLTEVPEAKPPLRSLITEIDSQATISEEVMLVAAELKIDLLDEGWHEIPLRLIDSAIRSAKVGDENARLVFDAQRGYMLLLENDGEEPQSLTVSLEYAKAYQKSPGKNYIAFQAPQAPINRWRIQVPDQGVDINVQPNIASQDLRVQDTGAPEDPAAEGEDALATEPSADSIMQAFVGGADRVQIDWTAKAEGAAGLAALVTVQTRQQVTIEEGVIRTRAHLIYDISRSDIDTLQIQVPNDHNVVNVFDPNLQRWEKAIDGDIQTLTLSLFQPTRGTQPVVIELEKFAGGKAMSRPMMQTEIVAPVIRATQAGSGDTQVTVGRQQGIVVVKLDSSLRGETTNRSGLTQIDTAELPAELAGQAWTFGYRYAAVPFDLRLSVEKLLPEVEVEQLVETFVEPDKITTSLSASFTIERAGIFQVELLIPRGYTIRSVQGRAVANGQPLVVESYQVADDDMAEADPDASTEQKLVVNLGRRAMGVAGLYVLLDQTLNEPNLAQPTGEDTTLTVPVPRVDPDSVNNSRGSIIVSAPESLRLLPSTSSGVTPISAAEASKTLGLSTAARFPQLRQIAAYAFTQQPIDLQFEGQRRRPYIEAKQFLSVNVESGVASFRSNITFDIRYSGVDSLRIDLPSELADSIRNDSVGLRERPIDPQPDDVADGNVAWTLSGEGELLGTVVAAFSWEQELGDLPVGSAVPIEIPRIVPQGVDRSWGQIVASKAETIEISVSTPLTGLRPIDPQRDLISGYDGPQAARAFEFYSDWSLTLQATRYELEEVKRTSIDRAFVRMVTTRSKEVSVQALYRMRSARQRIAIKIPGVDPGAPANNLDAQPLRVNGQPALLEHDGTQFYIPFTGFSPDEAVLVELRYTVTEDVNRLQVPSFPEDPAVQQVYLAAFLPDDLELLFVDGPWTDESEPNIWTGIDPYTTSDDELLAELTSGVAVSGLAGRDFPVDGRRYLFSTLRPEPGVDGALKLTSVKQLAVHTGIVLVVAAVGILLCFRPFLTRIWWLALLATIVVVSAIFAPRFAESVWAAPFFVTVSLTIALWVIQGIVKVIPKVGKWVNQVMAPSPVQLAAAGAQESVSVTAADSASTVVPTPPAPPQEESRGSDVLEIRDDSPESSSESGDNAEGESKEGGKDNE